MANNNTIAALVDGNIQKTLAPLALGTSTTETGFSVNGNAIAGIAAAPAVLQLPQQGAVPSQYAGMPFVLRAIGTITTGVSTNITLTLYQVPSAIVLAGSALTLANDASVKASSAVAVNSTTAPFIMEAKLQWDPVGKALKGQAMFEINNTLGVFAATTAITGLATDAELNFILSALSSSGNAANVINLLEFSVENL